jgi:4-carboxymuconolactone decarboxylase
LDINSRADRDPSKTSTCPTLLRNARWGRSLRFWRPSGLELGYATDDLVDVLSGVAEGLDPKAFPIDGVTWPKAERADELVWLCDLLSQVENRLGLSQNRIRVQFLVESASAVLRLSELAILITARQWSQQVEWAIHAPIAQKAGVAAATIEAIAQGRQPVGLPADEAAVYAFSTELHRNQGVSDASWAWVVNLLGEQGAVDLIGINGYYALLSMVMNASRTPAPSTAAAPLPLLTGSLPAGPV